MLEVSKTPLTKKSFSPSVKSDLVTQIKVQQIPPYPDKGVYYAGYSKRLIKENEYEQYPQDRFNFFSNAHNEDFFNRTGYTLYVTRVRICYSVASFPANADFSVYESATKIIVYQLIVGNAASTDMEMLTWDFTGNPLPLDNEGHYSTNTGGAGIFVVSIEGFVEKNP